MKKNHILSGMWVGVNALVCLSLSQLSLAAEYKVDASHSNVDFTVRHLVSKLKGSFSDFSGTMKFDPAKPEESKVEAEVKVTSVNTGEKKRDEHLKSPDFFDAKKFPAMKFVSSEVKADGDKKYKMKGDLTIRGVTKPVTFDVDYLGESDDPWGGHRAGFTATTTIDRKDYGMTWNKALDKGGVVVGEEVTINLNVEASQTALAKSSAKPAAADAKKKGKTSPQ